MSDRSRTHPHAADEPESPPAVDRDTDQVWGSVKGINRPGGSAINDPTPIVRWASRGAAGILRYLVTFARENQYMPADEFDLLTELHQQFGEALKGLKRGHRKG